MCQKDPHPNGSPAAIAAIRARLAVVLVILFVLVLLVTISFPHAMLDEGVLIFARLLEVVISYYFRHEDT